MPMPLHDIEVAAMQLPAEERSRLAGRLLESLEPESHDTPQSIEAAWGQEIARRIDALEAGSTESIPHEQVRAQLRALIAAHDAK